MWQPPTDNLYKFMAIFGLVLFALGVYVSLVKGDEYNMQVVRWNAAYGPLFVKHNQLWVDTRELLVCAIERADGKVLNSGRERQCSDIEQRQLQIETNSRALAVAGAELSGTKQVLDYVGRQVLIYQLLGLLLGTFGFTLGWKGFRLWYFKVQVHLDAEAARAAEQRGTSPQNSSDPSPIANGDTSTGAPQNSAPT